MSTLTKFIVKSSNPNKQGKYVLKLSADVTVHVFGQNKTIKRTFYIGGMTQPVVVGTIIEEDLSRFDITKRPVAVVKNADGTVKHMTIEEAEKAAVAYERYELKWLHAKAA